MEGELASAKPDRWTGDLNEIGTNADGPLCDCPVVSLGPDQ